MTEESKRVYTYHVLVTDRPNPIDVVADEVSKHSNMRDETVLTFKRDGVEVGKIINVESWWAEPESPPAAGVFFDPTA